MMDTNALLALNANLQIEAVMEEVLDDRRGMKRQLIIDLETSGLTPETGDIIRFRAVNRWDPDDEFDEPVKPSRPMSAEAERITGTTNERLAHCRSVDAALPDFLDFIDGAELIGENLDFDLMFLEAAENQLKR
jgi:DNA polymerase III epsilon subunit-like protein